MRDLNGIEITAGTYPCHPAVAGIAVCATWREPHRHDWFGLLRKRPRQLPEIPFMRVTMHLVSAYGQVSYHDEDARRQTLNGWPDLVIFGGTRILYRELKSEEGELSPDQRRIGSQLTKSGGDWAVWRPADLYSGAIERKLAEIRQ